MGKKNIGFGWYMWQVNKTAGVNDAFPSHFFFTTGYKTFFLLKGKEEINETTIGKWSRRNLGE